VGERRGDGGPVPLLAGLGQHVTGVPPERPVGFRVVALAVEGLGRGQAGGVPLRVGSGHGERLPRVPDGLRVKPAGDFDAGRRREVR